MKTEHYVLIGVLLLVAYFVFFRRKSANGVAVGTTLPGSNNVAPGSTETAGDSFTSGCGIVSGVTEPSAPVAVGHCSISLPPVTGLHCNHIVLSLPVDPLPPPIAIQAPPPVAATPAPVYTPAPVVAPTTIGSGIPAPVGVRQIAPSRLAPVPVAAAPKKGTAVFVPPAMAVNPVYVAPVPPVARPGLPTVIQKKIASLGR